MVLKYVQCFCDLILPDEPLEVQSKILLNLLISMLEAIRLLGNLMDILLNRTGLFEHGLVLECLSCDGQADRNQ